MPKRTNIGKFLIIGTAAIMFDLLARPFDCHAEEASQLTCDDVSRIDFKNGVVDLGSFGSFVFKDGRACGSEGVLPGQNPACDCASSKCDWDIQIQEDKVLSPEPRWQVRLLVVSESHLTGSGAWGQVLAFECRRGQLTKMLDRSYLYGVKFTQIKNGFELESGHWLPTDARCCPSRQQREWFRWDLAKSKYMRKRLVILRRNAQTH